jgi:hypothetical protein
VRRALLLLAFVLPVVACDILGVDADSFEGRYTLYAVNRTPLPYRFNLPAPIRRRSWPASFRCATRWCSGWLYHEIQAGRGSPRGQ